MTDDILPKTTPAILALADGSLFFGNSIGAVGETVGEVVFNTAMTGYQEILTDPSYAEQIVTLTYPHIGNTGINPDDFESDRAYAAGLIIRELSPIVSNWRATESLSDFLKKQKIIAISNIDTRKLTRILREKGAQNGCIMAGKNIDPAEAIKKAQLFPGLNNKNLADVVSTKKIYKYSNDKSQVLASMHVVVLDFGVKKNILDLLYRRGCTVTVVPSNTSVEKIVALKPDGIVLSNGPGDPAACHDVINNIRELLNQKTPIPIYGICLGIQLLALALGAKTIKMKFGHHGANHPVQDVISKKVYITSQNHGFCVDQNSLPDDLIITHISLFDNSLQGFKHKTLPVFAFQGHPEASPGPQDIIYLFDEFVSSINLLSA